jgi:rfaE bifunctional protein nucleotidyltransferase chain/domain
VNRKEYTNKQVKNIMKKVLVNGAFDLLHTGHIDLINFAKSKGDYLIVAIDTDMRISKAKGIERPVNNVKTRKVILENLKSVNEVKIFNTDDELIKIIKECDIRIIGSDWKNKPIVGQEYCKELIFFDRVNDESTTKTLENYLNRR